MVNQEVTLTRAVFANKPPTFSFPDGQPTFARPGCKARILKKNDDGTFVAKTLPCRISGVSWHWTENHIGGLEIPKLQNSEMTHERRF